MLSHKQENKRSNNLKEVECEGYIKEMKQETEKEEKRGKNKKSM